MQTEKSASVPPLRPQRSALQAICMLLEQGERPRLCLVVRLRRKVPAPTPLQHSLEACAPTEYQPPTASLSRHLAERFFLSQQRLQHFLVEYPLPTSVSQQEDSQLQAASSALQQERQLLRCLTLRGTLKTALQHLQHSEAYKRTVSLRKTDLRLQAALSAPHPQT